MSTSPNLAAEIAKLVGSVAVLAAGVRILLASWDAPAAGALPLVITQRDRERHDGQLNVRQVLLTAFGAGLIVWAARHLLG